MFLFMGGLHLIASFVLAIGGSDASLVYSQLIGGIFEIAIGLFCYLKYGEIV